MKALYTIIFGVLFGLTYAFVSFFLVTPFLRGNLMALVFWGAQGGIFSLFYLLISVLTKKFKANDLISIIKGGLCGLLSSLLYVFMSLEGFKQSTSKDGVVVLPEVSAQINLDLFQYTLGCIIIGAIAIWLVEERKRHK